MKHTLDKVAGLYVCNIASSFGKGSHKTLMGVLHVDDANGWSFKFQVDDHGNVIETQQLSTAIRKYNEAA